MKRPGIRARYTGGMVGVLLLTVSPVVMAETGSQLDPVIRALTAPALAGRGSGTPGAHAAADSLARWLATAGFVPGFHGKWFQEYPLQGEGWSGQDLSGKNGRNVAGVIAGGGVLADRWLILGAHYDHLGRISGDADPMSLPAPHEYYPGANDNASGVAVVLAVGRQLAVLPGMGEGRSVMVVFFGDEETGLQGSSAFVRNPPLDLTTVDIMVNLDTVGRLADGKLHVGGVGTAPPLRAVATEVAGELPVHLADAGWSGSDHMSFNTAEVPVLFLFGGAYPDYNRPTDTADNLVAKDLAAVHAYTAKLVNLLRIETGPFPWQMVGDGPLRDGDTGTVDGNRSTWFGSLPDFTAEEEGYRLAGVFDESPAARAGLQKGDLLVRLGGSKVSDLADFTRALRSHAPGDLVEVEVIRDSARLRFTVMLGNRADRR